MIIKLLYACDKKIMRGHRILSLSCGKTYQQSFFPLFEEVRATYFYQ